MSNIEFKSNLQSIILISLSMFSLNHMNKNLLDLNTLYSSFVTRNILLYPIILEMELF